MAVNVTNGNYPIMNRLQSAFNNRIRLGSKGYSQLFFWSFLFCYPSYSYAGPSVDNHTIISGTQSGSVSQAGLVTTINQFDALMAIDWDSYNLDRNVGINRTPILTKT